MTRISFTYDAPPGWVFTPDTFDSQIGTTIKIRYSGFGETGTLLAADVAENGRSVRLTIEADDD